MAAELLCFGETFDDFVFHGLSHLPRAGEEIKTEHFLRTVGGGALITACAAKRLGTETRVVSALGPDATARLDREGVSYRNLRKEGESPALTVALSTALDRSFVTFEGANRSLEERIPGVLRDEQEDASGPVRHFHGALYPRRPERWSPLLSELRLAGATCSWDFGHNPGLVSGLRSRAALEELLGALDILFLNEMEAKLYSGHSEIEDALDFFGARVTTTVVKRGALGCSWTSRDGAGSSPGFSVEACDTTGAGDAFDGGYLHAFLAGHPIETCARTANRVGALSTRKAGGIDALPRKEEMS
jgi:sugar/nucleoside kinase (ribokinase family)